MSTEESVLKGTSIFKLLFSILLYMIYLAVFVQIIFRLRKGPDRNWQNFTDTDTVSAYLGLLDKPHYFVFHFMFLALIHLTLFIRISVLFLLPSTHITFVLMRVAGTLNDGSLCNYNNIVFKKYYEKFWINGS